MSPAGALPDGPLVAFYGDDFTGASAVMEVMAFAGLQSVMFLDIPDAASLARFPAARCIGIAGIARSQPPGWMARELPPVFAALERLGAPVIQYKICSTLDSAPHIGSIGAALEIALPIVSRRPDVAGWQPLVVAAPAIRRYQAFGTLFAAFGAEVFRLDLHPVMRRHPVTPMDEADVRAHLSRQTAHPFALIDLLALKSGAAQTRLNEIRAAGNAAVALDVIDEETLVAAGALIWANRAGGLFALGSQGLEYALVAHWHAAGLLPPPPTPPRPAATALLPTVSGSVSATTAEQIAWAADHGFTPIALEAAAATDPARWQVALDTAAAEAAAALAAGRSPLVATARGPEDPAVARLAEALARSAAEPAAVNQRIGEGLGLILARLLRHPGISRAAVLGGDSSGHACRALGITALEAVAPLAPGCPLCRAHGSAAPVDGLEIALKGGQMGPPDILGIIRAGGATAHGST
ncbi:four-carbon acid sugar kinase family protein [Solirhodobacter olei]|uniref:four-carbon acid sugar kinase family protein n=1 Tax=Solirhodobacter olei TaxID=2493082 RepID=UPI000FD8A50C|nr:four-carbon acid sugar kinase family protein [Solirhodobacter olei]